MTRLPKPAPPRESADGTSREGATVWSRHGLVDAPLLVAHFPPALPFGFLGRLLPTSLAAELRWQAHRVDPRDASELLHRAEVSARTELESGSGGIGRRPAHLRREAESAEALGAAVAAREQELWRFGISFHGLGRSRIRAERARDSVARSLEALGFRTRVPRFEVSRSVGPPDLQATEPRPPEYWHLLPTEGLAAFFPHGDELIAEPGGILVGLLMEDATPLVLDRWSHGSYSWGLFGMTGAGKTFAAALWALRSRWMSPGLDLIFIDPLGEFSGLVRRLGGTVVRLHDGEMGRVNPLDPVTTGGDLDEKASRITAMLGVLFPSLRDEEVADLDSALRRRLDADSVAPTFSDVSRVLEDRPRSARLVQLLEVFRSGSLRYLDGPTTLNWDASPFSFDFRGAPAHQLPFLLTFSLDALSVRLRQRPGRKLVVVDEAHLLTREPRTAEFLERLVRLVRHYETGLILLSQNPDDFLVTDSGRALALNLRATTFLRVASVSTAAREFFRLTSEEAEWLPRARLPREAGYSEGLVRSGPGHFPVAVVASTPEFEFLRAALAVSATPEGASDAAPTARL